MHGFFNRILRIDLSNQSHSYDHLPDPILEKTLGGKGLAAHLLLEENPPGVDPLSPENKFLIVSGPLSGTRMWGSARFGAYSKSPATGGFGESYCGGTLADRLKGCGVDAVILIGRCPSLTSLYIDEEGVNFADVSDLVGRDTVFTEEYVVKHAPHRDSKFSVMTIGPAGEKEVRFACIKSDRWRSLGRGGLGAVLGSKNVKAIAFSGSRQADLADSEGLRKIVRDLAQIGKESPVTQVYRNLGTPSMVALTNEAGSFPSRYWQTGRFASWKKLSADYMRENFQVKACGCPHCFLRCTKLSEIKHGRHQGLTIEGPEYETIYAIGGLNELDSLEEVAFLNDLCDRLGLDTMSAGNIAGFAIEAFKRGKTDFPIDYNQPDRIAELMRLIAAREGIGDLLAKGIKTAAAELGLEDLAVHVKGLEPAGFDPRVLKGMGLAYATSARGACHLRGTFYKAELSGQVDREQITGKARAFIDYEDRAALFDSLILCRFFRDFILWEELGRLIEVSTGMELGKRDLETLAGSITQASRRYNVREGLGPETDTLPPWLLNNPTREGAEIEAGDLQTMIDEYDSIRKASP